MHAVVVTVGCWDIKSNKQISWYQIKWHHAITSGCVTVDIQVGILE